MEWLIILGVVVAIAAIASSKSKGKKKPAVVVVPTPTKSKLNNEATISSTVDGRSLSVKCDTARGGAVSSIKLGTKEFVDNHDLGRQFQLAMRYNSDNPEAVNPTEAGNHAREPSKVLELYSKSNTLITKTQAMYYQKAGTRSANGNKAVNEKDLSDTIISKEVSLGYKGIDNVIVCKSKFVLEDIAGLEASYEPTQFGISSRSGASFNKVWLYNPKSEQLEKRSVVRDYPNGKNYASHFKPFVVSDGTYAWALASRDVVGNNYSIKYARSAGSDLVGEVGVTGLFDVYRVPSKKHAVHKFETYLVLGSMEEVTESLRALHKIFKSEQG